MSSSDWCQPEDIDSYNRFRPSWSRLALLKTMDLSHCNTSRGSGETGAQHNPLLHLQVLTHDANKRLCWSTFAFCRPTCALFVQWPTASYMLSISHTVPLAGTQLLPSSWGTALSQLSTFACANCSLPSVGLGGVLPLNASSGFRLLANLDLSGNPGLGGSLPDLYAALPLVRLNVRGRGGCDDACFPGVNNLHGTGSLDMKRCMHEGTQPA